MKKSNVVRFVAVFLLLTFSLISTSTARAYVTVDQRGQSVYSSWNSSNDWLIVQGAADTTGDSYRYPNTVTEVRRINTFTLAYANYRQSWGTYFFPGSRNHKIVSKLAKYEPNPSTVKYTQCDTYSNVQTSSLDPAVQYALDTLWNYLMSILQLPFPSPWGLIPTGNGITVTKDTDLMGITVSYNYSPQVQGCDYQIYINKDPQNGYAPTGGYYIDVMAQAEAGLLVSTPSSYDAFSDSYNINETINSINKENLTSITLPDTIVKDITVSGPRGPYKQQIISHMPITKYAEKLHSQNTNGLQPMGVYWVKEGDINIWLKADFEIYAYNQPH
jgi:hypothetical protein